MGRSAAAESSKGRWTWVFSRQVDESRRWKVIRDSRFDLARNPAGRLTLAHKLRKAVTVVKHRLSSSPIQAREANVSIFGQIAAAVVVARQPDRQFVVKPLRQFGAGLR